MAAEKPKINAALAAQIGKLESELKVAFKEGRFEIVRKKADEIMKGDPENRVASRILEKVVQEEAVALKKANAEKIASLEVKMAQAFKTGNLATMTQALESIKKLDPQNKKALSAEATIAKAKAALEADVQREKVRKLAAEVEFFVNKADWGGATAKANELLALEWGNSMALKALGKSAKAKGVKVETLITVKAPKIEKKPGFFARLFGKGAVEPTSAIGGSTSGGKVPEEGAAKASAIPAPLKSEVSFLKPVAPVVTMPVPAKSEVSVLKPLAPTPAVSPMMPAKSAVEMKPVVPTVVPLAPKPSMPVMATPAAIASTKPLVAPAPMAPVALPLVKPMAAKPVETQLKVEQKAVAKPESKTQEKGNIFTSLFGKEEGEMGMKKPATSVLETIVAKTEPSKAEVKKEKVPEEKTGEAFLGFARAFLRFSILFIAISASFLYVENMDADNRVLKLIKKESNASQLHNASLELDKREAEVKKLNEEIGKYKGGYVDEHEKTIQKIIADRMDWPTILKKLSDVTASVYEKNAISQYVQYNNYTYSSDTGQLMVAGTLSDPLGKNLTKLAELESAFQNFPKDPTNPNDDRKPYFYGLQEFKSFAKTFNAATGRFQSTFTLTLFTKEPEKKGSKK